MTENSSSSSQRGIALSFSDRPLSEMSGIKGTVVVLLGIEKTLSSAAAEANRLTKGLVDRAIESGFKPAHGKTYDLAFPAGLQADRLVLCGVGAVESLDPLAARRLGGELAGHLAASGGDITLFSDLSPLQTKTAIAIEVAFGFRLRSYRFDLYKKADINEKKISSLTVITSEKQIDTAWAEKSALAEGIEWSRDLVNEPANVLTPAQFAQRIQELSCLGIEISFLYEGEMAALGMNAILAVGQGSTQQSCVAVMKWQGDPDQNAAPLCLTGKGVCFDSGGISIKPSEAMEQMTMDMGGAAIVAGTMKTLALRKARLNVVGIVGLVENMPDGNAQRPGDIVKAMSGTTIEVINTDAEGRMVLADVLWYAQTQFRPKAVIDLATLTGAIVVALGVHHAGWYSNDEPLAERFAKATKNSGEAAWRMPLGPEYAKQIKSSLADIKNTGGRYGGSITAAEFLRHFIQENMPWIHIDIAGVTLLLGDVALAPKGASGWGVATLDRLVADYES